MNSEELNKAISEVCDRDDLAIEGGKCIPYIGWVWRDVDFDVPYCFGIIPHAFVGFMENNKWGYGHTRYLTVEERDELKRLLEVAVTNPTRYTTQAVWDYVQSFREETK